MREIKFRAFDKKVKRMFTPTMLDFHHTVREQGMVNVWHQHSQVSDDGEWKDHENIELMQFTGLKDKNGVEIYENDILSLVYGSINMIGYVKLEDSGEWILYKDKGNYLSVHSNIDRIKIIGNIHENPELLEK